MTPSDLSFLFVGRGVNTGIVLKEDLESRWVLLGISYIGVVLCVVLGPPVFDKTPTAPLFHE